MEDKLLGSIVAGAKILSTRSRLFFLLLLPRSRYRRSASRSRELLFSAVSFYLAVLFKSLCALPRAHLSLAISCRWDNGWQQGFLKDMVVRNTRFWKIASIT